MNLLKIAQQAIQAVPALKYGLVVVGISSLGAFVYALTLDFRSAIFVVIFEAVMFISMTVLVVFVGIALGRASIFALPGIIFAYFALVLAIFINLSLFLGPKARVSKHAAPPESRNPFEEGLPQPSARFSLRLCESAGKTLGELSDNLLAALNRAGYTDHAIYPFQDGFAVLTRFEQRDSAGNPSSDRWPELGQPAVPLSKLFSVDYIRALFLGKRGVFRFFIFTLTSEYARFKSKETSPAEARTWLLTGPTDLPSDVRRSRTEYPFLFTSVVYEFEAAEDHAKFVEQSALTGLTELLGSKIVAKPNSELVPISICFDSQLATLQ